MTDERLKEMNLSEMLFNRDERLLDYITNLQEENKYLDELRNANYLSWQDSLSRIEKTVEYITNNKDICYYGKCNDGDLLIEVEEDFKNELLNILNGKE